MKEFEVIVTSVVTVKLDETKFDETFMKEFRDSFFPFFDLRDHAEHIAQLLSRNIADFDPRWPEEFVEGYGEIGAMGIEAKIMEVDMETVSEYDA